MEDEEVSEESDTKGCTAEVVLEVLREGLACISSKSSLEDTR